MKIPANIDDKDVLTDWIADIFDNNCVMNGNEALGFVNNAPVRASWSSDSNQVSWWVIERHINTYDETIREICKRLKEYGFEGVSVEYDIVEQTAVHQYFYFKDDTDDGENAEKTHFEKALEYVRKNKTWSDVCEAYALELMDRCRCPITMVSDEISNQIRDLMDEYGQDNGLDEDWWAEYGEIDDIFFAL